ncbi:MAG: alpha-amylase family protein [Verrucomicrobiota bacterium]|nr:alpha-amylase family protein [Verrucomicrobiota bacterium]
MSVTGPVVHNLVGNRQVHLDFHTSEQLYNIGNKFSKDQFQSSLKLAHVDAVNLFAKCHHSWSYYPTAVGRMHPNLSFDLLGAQIEACREVGIKVQIYYTFGWSANDAESHPEWCVRERDGSFLTNGSFNTESNSTELQPNFYWKFLCSNTGYHEYVLAQIEELCLRYNPDGFWLDIYQAHRHCFCGACQSAMSKQGVNIDDHLAVEVFNANNMKKHCSAIRQLVQEHHPNAQVFFNGTTAIEKGVNFRQSMYENNTVQDLEDLPTVWGGYDKLPLQSKYFLQSGYKIAAMSGKFHTAWGEFGGFKHPEALRYEAASMVAWGAGCNFGDQLHPNGLMDQATYENIGVAYSYVKEIEEYGIGGLPASRLGLWRSFSEAHDEGLSKILLEAHINFEVANLTEDLSNYSAIIVPGAPCLLDEDADRLNAYAREGGYLVVLGAGVFASDKKTVLLDIGADFLGEAKFDCDYLVVGEPYNSGLVSSPFLNYQATRRFLAHPETAVLATLREPYFSRTRAQYCSHQNTPYSVEVAEHPGIIRNGNIIYVAPELDWMYLKYGARLHRDLLVNILLELPINPMVTTTMPSAGRMAFMHQAHKHRYIAHFLYAPPMQRGKCEIIEDMPPLYDVPLQFDLPQSVTSAKLVPDDISLPITWAGRKGNVTVPKFSCHCAVVLQYS